MNFVVSSWCWLPKIFTAKTQIPAVEERDVERFEIEISGVVAAYAKKAKIKYILLTIYATGQGSVLAGVLSAEKMKNLLGCTSAWSTFIVSGLVSVSIIVSLILIFFQQFHLLQRGRQLQQGRDSMIERGRNPSSFPCYKKDVFEKTSAWWPPRAASLVVLTAISVCLLVSCARILCPL